MDHVERMCILEQKRVFNSVRRVLKLESLHIEAALQKVDELEVRMGIEMAFKAFESKLYDAILG